jgi:sugar (pentulose or hexulose) kinase
MSRYILGIDAGTSVIKAALFDRDFREIVTAARRTQVRTPQPDRAEIDMGEVWAQTAGALRAVTAQIDAREIAAVALTGNMVGAWLIDGDGLPVRDAILWNDGRTQALIDRREAEKPGFMAHIFRSSGSVMQQGCTLPLLRWLSEHEPDVLARAARALSCKGWLLYKLTGVMALDPTEASVLPGDTRTRSYSEAMIDWLGVRPQRNLLPAVLPSEAIAGTVSAAAADVTGLAAGTPVVIGAGDVPASALGAGAAAPGDACTLMGTTILNCLALDQPVFEPADVGLLFCLPPDGWLRAMANIAGTTNLDWVVALLYGAEQAAALDSRALFALLEDEARRSPPGAGGLLYLPYLSAAGIIAPVVHPGARAQFFGLNPTHGRADLLRAVYEGVAFAIRDGYAVIPADVRSIRLAGGGARSAFWSQMIADVTGRHVLIPEGSEFGARGAAALAAVGLGWYASVGEAVAVYAGQAHAFEPQTDQVRGYEQRYRLYVQLRQQLMAVWDSARQQAGGAV